LFDRSREKIEMQEKISIRFFNDREVRAVWDGKDSRWLFSVLDIVSVLRDEDDYQKTRNYWKYLKSELSQDFSKSMAISSADYMILRDRSVQRICPKMITIR